MIDFLQYLTWSSPVFYALIFWAIVWKGLALWYSARSKQKYWFIAFLVLNTLGILPIIYLFAFSKIPFLKELRKMQKKRKKRVRRRKKKR